MSGECEECGNHTLECECFYPIRAIPPKINKNTMNLSEFKKYILSHKILFLNKKNETRKMDFKEFILKFYPMFNDRNYFIESVSSFFPVQYQEELFYFLGTEMDQNGVINYKENQME